MQNKFGLKDLVLCLLIGGVALSIWLSMKQQDRQWEQTRDLLAKLTSLEAQVSRVQSKLDSGLSVSAAASAPANPVQAAGGAKDESWARPGVTIQWQPPYLPATDPRTQPGFQPGGECTEVWETQLGRLTPYISSDVYGRRIQELVVQSLADYDAKTLKHTGQLAEAWQIDPKGLWLRARIRPEARFSDGKPVTAEDVRWSYHDYLMNEEVEAERVRSFIRDSIKKVVVIDDRTVEFEFFEPLAVNEGNALRTLLVLPKHIYSQFTPAQINRGTGLLVGSGPFRLRGFDPDNQWTPPADVVLERNEQYWSVKPPLDVLRFKGITVEIARLNAFKKGDADIITPSAPQFVSVEQDPAWNTPDKARFLKWVNMRSGYSFIAWNCGMRNGKLTPFHDKRVRLAMTHLIDREKLIRDIYSGIGVVAKGVQNPMGPGANPEITPWPFDRKRGLELLKEAGWEDRNGDGMLEDKAGNTFEFEFSYPSGSEISERVANFVMDTYTAAGMKVRKQTAEWAKFQDFLKLRDFDAITLGWGASGPESDPKQIFHSDAIKGQGDNFVQWSNPDADRLIEEGRREMDFDKRMRIWQQLEKVLHEEQPYTFMRVPPWLRIASPKMMNIQTYFKGLQHDEFFRGGASVPTTGN